MLEMGRSISDIKKILADGQLYGYIDRVDLFKRIKTLADNDVANLRDYLSKLSNWPGGRSGYAWELASASKIMDTGEDTINTIAIMQSRMDKWGADYIGEKFIYQAKSSATEFEGNFHKITTKLGVKEQAIRHHIGAKPIAVIVPTGTQIPENFLEWFSKRTPKWVVKEVDW